MTLPTTVYTAGRGYAWSCIPEGWTKASLDALLALAAKARPAFAGPSRTDFGVVADGTRAAAFAWRTAPEWDAERRAADYVAFALLACADARRINFIELLRNPFFHIPSRQPPTSLDCAETNDQPNLRLLGPFLARHTCDNLSTADASGLLALCARKCGEWRFTLNPATGRFHLTTAAWHNS